MTGAHLHLLLNHIPVFGMIAGALVLLVGVLRRSRDIVTLALFATVITALLTIPVYLSGEPAEKIVDRLPGVTNTLIHEHEDAALYAIITIELAGAAALVALLMRRTGREARAVVIATLVLAALSAVIVGKTAAEGGKIRHTEIRSDAAPAGGESHEAD